METDRQSGRKCLVFFFGDLVNPKMVVDSGVIPNVHDPAVVVRPQLSSPNTERTAQQTCTKIALLLHEQKLIRARSTLQSILLLFPNSFRLSESVLSDIKFTLHGARALCM